MTELIAQERIIEPKDWATALFILSFSVVAITRATFAGRFSEFMNLIVSDKYNKIYKDRSHLFSWFSIAMMFVLFISLSFFMLLILHHFQLTSKYNLISFIQLLTFCVVFILSKFLIDKIIAVAFDFEELIEHYNLQKVNYRSYFALCLLPINMFLYYTDNLPTYFIYSLIIIILLINVISYLSSLRIYQNFIIRKLFYFILYLCTLEIAPYYFIYYWFINN